MFESILIALTAIALIGVACQWLAWWLKLPAILLLLLAGIVAGPLTGLIRPDALFGDLLFPMVSLGVAVVLFEGSLSLKLHEIRGLGGVVRNLVSFGALLNWLLITLAAHWLMDFPWQLAFLFGAVVVVTGPTVIQPLLRSMRPTANIANILRWEGIIIDPLGALLAVLVFEFIVSGQQRDTLITFSSILAVGIGFGLLGAYALGTLLRRRLLPDYLNDVTTLALVLGVFTLADSIEHESGLLAVTVMGIMLANMKEVPIEEIVDFKESLSILMISVLFIILAARLDTAQLSVLGTNSLLLLGAIVFVARPLMAFAATLGSQLNWRERLILAWVAPRGIVAAAVSALFALRLSEAGMEQAELLVPLTFLVIIGTVILQSLTARPLANLLGVSEPEPRGVLIVGANKVARTLGKLLQEKGFPVLITGTHWDDIKAARMEGLSSYFGHAVSEHADRNLDLVGIGQLLAMSRRPALNALACLRYKSEFGANNVYGLQMPEEKGTEKRAIARPYACTRLFGDEITLPKLASMLSQEAELRTTHLSESFDYEAYQQQYGGRAIPLFAIDSRGRLRPFAAGRELAPGPEWRIVTLVPAELAERLREEAAAREHKQEQEA